VAGDPPLFLTGTRRVLLINRHHLDSLPPLSSIRRNRVEEDHQGDLPPSSLFFFPPPYSVREAIELAFPENHASERGLVLFLFSSFPPDEITRGARGHHFFPSPFLLFSPSPLTTVKGGAAKKENELAVEPKSVV